MFCLTTAPESVSRNTNHMSRFFRTRLFVAMASLAAFLIVLSVVPQAEAHGGPIYEQDFNGTDSCPGLAATVAPADGSIHATATQTHVGTIDVADSTAASGAIELSVIESAHSTRPRYAAMTSGLIPVSTAETDLAKLTLSFDNSVSSVRPVVVQIESYDAGRNRTGGRQTTVYPAAPDFYLRSAIELSNMMPFGDGKFNPTDPYIRLSFRISGASNSTPDPQPVKLRIDNIEYASPAYYVSPRGSDNNDGLTEATPFKDPQKAVNLAQPGDIILLMAGVYHRGPLNDLDAGVIGFVRAGTPAGWITVKNYPGQVPILNSDAWNTIEIGRGTKSSPCKDPALAYLEVRGLHIHGNARLAQDDFPQDINVSAPDSNGNGISVDARNETYVPHHLRFADNYVDDCCGGGIVTLYGDYITTENNVIKDNCWWSIYAPSGISYLGGANFDNADDTYKNVIRYNVVQDNRCYEQWTGVGWSDGNGIIIDTNFQGDPSTAHTTPGNSFYELGRTLVQDNLVVGNGGSGIHAYFSRRVDIINNSAYWNGANPHLRWGEIFVNKASDVTMIDNIEVSRPGQPIDTIGSQGGDLGSTNVLRLNNIYFGGLAPTLTGPGDVFADPLYVSSSDDFTLGDFHVLPGSPALNAGIQEPFSPLLDLDGKLRRTKGRPDIGAYQR